MERPPIQNKETVSQERHKTFLTERFRDIASKGLLGSGSVFALAGIYEFITGNSVGDVFSAYADALPDAARWVIDHLDAMPSLSKLTGGASMIGLGGYLDRPSHPPELGA